MNVKSTWDQMRTCPPNLPEILTDPAVLQKIPNAEQALQE
jgi:hypothetical protein